MRIHRLELTAFGPFPGNEAVDFEPLNAAGLFLLTGPTGAGKTSVLDAICFALYGAVPGDRNGAKSFKSDHAPPDAVPSVMLELTVRGRRLRLRRQPGWSRPSRRAKTGVVEEKAKAAIEELVDDTWVTHSTRVDEVGHLVTSLLGMNKDQFCQVVMLPQGEFQTFLSAGAKERHDVLESLFRTHRFQAIERWLVDHRRALDAHCRDAEADLDRLLARADEVLAGARLPASTGLGMPMGGPSSATADRSPDATSSEREPATSTGTARTDYAQAMQSIQASLAALTSSASEAAEAKLLATEEAKTAQHALDAARTLVDLQQRHRDAENRLTELMSAAGEVRRREREVLLARRASAFEPLLALVAEAHQATTAAAGAVATAQQELAVLTPQAPDLAPPSSLDDVSAHRDVLQSELAGLDALVEVQDELDALVAAIAADDQAIEESRQTEIALAATLATLPGEVERVRDLLAAGRDADSRLAGLTQDLARAEQIRDATRSARELAVEAASVDEALVSAREVRADARDELHLVRSRRIAGMAADLASTLEKGQPCQVCGSKTHPSPARPEVGSVTPEDEAEAEDAVHRAEDALGQLQLRRERLRADKATADHASDGHTTQTADVLLAAADAKLRSCTEEAATVDERVAQLHALEIELDAAHQAKAACTTTIEAHRARQTEREQTAARLHRRIRKALGDADSLSDRRQFVRRRLAATNSLADAVRSHADAVMAERAAVERLDNLVAGSVFATVRQVRDAVRSEPDIASGEALNRAHATEKMATERTLADPNLARAAAQPSPELDLLQQIVEQTSAAAAEATATAGRLEDAATRLESLATQLSTRVGRWQPLRVRLDRAEHVSALVNGTSRDNLTKTKLSHYVLTARLVQVVEAANLRLRGICGGRYELSHSVHRGVGDARGGLGLRVLDTYTGAKRDPATLSGGETFYVSLALALGLADLVNNEIGGTELSTLFVDEGFGMLDADTLDEVMDELDALRSGGRSVGLVSHLAELRIRVPAQLSVVRSTSGSRLDDSR